MIKRINAPDNPHKGQPLNKYFTKKFQALKDSNKPLETVDQVVQLIFKEQTKISKNLASVSELAGRDVDVMQLLASKSKNDDKSDGEGRHKRKHEGPSANTKRPNFTNSKGAGGGGNKGAGSGNGQSKTSCWGCGRFGHKKDECHFKEHPDFNKTASKWEDSDVGKAQKQAGHDFIQWGKKLQGDKLVSYDFKRPSKGKLDINEIELARTELLDGLVDEILDFEEDTSPEKDPDQLMTLITKSLGVGGGAFMLALVATLPIRFIVIFTLGC